MDKIAGFEAMLARGQDSEMLRYSLGKAYADNGQHDVAVEHLEQALRFKPDYTAAWRQLGQSFTAMGNIPRALGSYEQGLKVAQDNGDMQALREMQVFKRRLLKQQQTLEEAAPGRQGMSGMTSDAVVWLRNQFYLRTVGSVLPATWFAPPAPRPDVLTAYKNKLNLQIVSHCWNYSHLSVYQLSSLVNYPPTRCHLTYTLYYSDEDKKQCSLIEQFDAKQVEGITWDWQVLPKAQLFRRAIGRHRAATLSTADWIWFADCDLIFHQNCLDSLAVALSGKRTGLVYPAYEGITDLLEADHPLLNQQVDPVQERVDVDPALFSRNSIHKAKGAFQIVHGDVARAAGYCGSIRFYQTPTDTWRKTYEDTLFRKLIGYEGEPVQIDGLYRIRHAEKGRYAGNSSLTRFRKALRRTTDRASSQ